MSYPSKLSEKLPWNFYWYAFAIILFGLSFKPDLISSIYSPFIYKPMTYLLRGLFGKIGFSIGEIVYLCIIILLVFSILRWLFNNKSNFRFKEFWKVQFVKWLNGLVLLYIVFELIWGLNYQKSNPAKDFKLNVPTVYTERQMDSLTITLAASLNDTRLKMGDFDPKLIQFDSILAQIRSEFMKNGQKYPFLKYQNASLKRSLFPSWGDYIGYTAFYQPITGEAIVRGDLPQLTWPFTMSHEIAHQLGYASESEANFIAYVIGTESTNPLINYSTQLELFTYAQFAHLEFIVKTGDFEKYKMVVARNKKLLSPQVLTDRMAIKKFFLQKQAMQIKGTSEMYNQFLIWNKQTKGIESYNDVLLWVLAYKTKI